MADEIFIRTTRIERPAAEVFRWHEREGAFARLCPPWERIKEFAATGGIRDGARVTVLNKRGLITMKWQVEHRDYLEGKQFKDVQLSGPFSTWEHVHRMEEDGPNACWLTDEISFRLPGGRLGAACGNAHVRRTLARLFAWRHAITKADLELANHYGPIRPLRILIAGGSGLIGSALVPFLQTQGHTVVRLVRRTTDRSDEIFWNPATGEINATSVEGIDAVINLSGENVGAGRWTNRRRVAIRQSRENATRTLVEVFRKLERKPRLFVNASAIGVYGDRGDEALTERADPGHGFLAEVCRAWEATALRAGQSGVRTAILRLGVVLSPAGGALQKLAPLFRIGLGGSVGSGRQWMSWATIDDVVGAFYHAIVDERCQGEFNVVAPAPVTNAEFAATLGQVLHRPAGLPVPAAVLRLVFGEMADATLLASIRATPEKLKGTGFVFRYSSLREGLTHVLGRSEL